MCDTEPSCLAGDNMNRMAVLLMAWLFCICAAAGDVGNCSTFLVQQDDQLRVGHNLDESPDLFIPGLVCVNKRGEYREGLTWAELVSRPEIYARTVAVPFENRPEPKINWTSRYASITFNSEGVDFPDGGMNEKGLCIFEMSMGLTRFMKIPAKPTLFICLWIQYQLDNFATVDDVVANLGTINQDGWSWHYFIADRTGDYAIVEYLKNRIVVYRGEQAPMPLLCNTSYKRELLLLNREPDLLSRIKRLIGKRRRFQRGLLARERLAKNSVMDLDQQAREIVDAMAIRGWNKWQIIADPVNLKVDFRTHRNRAYRTIDLNRLDLASGSPARVLDIHGPGSGDVTEQLMTLSRDANRALTRERADWLFKDRLTGLMNIGVTAEAYALRFSGYSEKMRVGIQ